MPEFSSQIYTFSNINLKMLSVAGRKDYWLKNEIMVYRYTSLEVCEY